MVPDTFILQEQHESESYLAPVQKRWLIILGFTWYYLLMQPTI